MCRLRHTPARLKSGCDLRITASKVAPREPLLVLDTGGGFYLPAFRRISMVLSPTLARPAVLPSREQIDKLFEQGDLVPVYRTLLADLETPVSVYMKLSQ